MLEGLAEANSWINGDPVAGNTFLLGQRGSILQKFGYLGHDIPIFGPILHRARLPLHVHQDQSGTDVGDRFSHCRVSQRRNVIDDRGPGCERTSGNAGLGGVDRDPGSAGHQTGNDRENTSLLYLSVDRIGSWTRGLAAHINQIGPLRQQAQTVINRDIG